MARVVILGSNGQLGSDLVKVLRPNHDIVASVSADVNATNHEVMKQLEKYADADYIINSIAITNVDGCEDNPDLAFQVNSAFVVKLAQFCKKNDIVLIHISTDYVFDGETTQPYSENDYANPLNVYGLSKFAGEIAVRNYADKYFILRVSSLFGVAGASGKGGNFVTTMLKLAKEKDQWDVIADQLTCPTHTLDVARAIKSLIDKHINAFGVYNCVSRNSCSWFDFTNEILTQAGLDSSKIKPISYNDYPFKARRLKYGILDVSKVKNIYPMPDYQTALAEYLELIRVKV